MPKDSTPTRRAIVDGALDVLRRDGLTRFSVEAVARRAGVAKGLVIYHFGSRGALLAECARLIAAARADGISAALASTRGVGRVDACWDELVRQQADGTARAWLGLVAAGLAPPGPAEEFEARARGALLDGCSAALAAGASPETLRTAHDALWLALVSALEDETA